MIRDSRPDHRLRRYGYTCEGTWWTSVTEQASRQSKSERVTSVSHVPRHITHSVGRQPSPPSGGAPEPRPAPRRVTSFPYAGRPWVRRATYIGPQISTYAHRGQGSNGICHQGRRWVKRPLDGISHPRAPPPTTNPPRERGRYREHPPPPRQSMRCHRARTSVGPHQPPPHHPPVSVMHTV